MTTHYMSREIVVDGVTVGSLNDAALAFAEETGSDPAADVVALRDGEMTPDSFRDCVFDGIDDDDAERNVNADEYADTIVSIYMSL
jgi:hypothetical protein